MVYYFFSKKACTKLSTG